LVVSKITYTLRLHRTTLGSVPDAGCRTLSETSTLIQKPRTTGMGIADIQKHPNEPESDGVPVSGLGPCEWQAKTFAAAISHVPM
jgi:hypothetical protein